MDHEQAKAQYRAAWTTFLLETDPAVLRELEKLMDEAQPFIAVGPGDPAWKAFTRTLPGFKQFWDRAGAARVQGASSRRGERADGGCRTMAVVDELREREAAVVRAQNRLAFWFAVGIWLVVAWWTLEALRGSVPPATLPQAGSRALGRADHPAE